MFNNNILVLVFITISYMFAQVYYQCGASTLGFVLRVTSTIYLARYNLCLLGKVKRIFSNYKVVWLFFQKLLVNLHQITKDSTFYGKKEKRITPLGRS